jgi:hypothetical protein
MTKRLKHRIVICQAQRMPPRFVLRAGCVRVCVAEVDRCVSDVKKSHAMNTSFVKHEACVFDFFFHRLFLLIFHSIPVTTVQE